MHGIDTVAALGENVAQYRERFRLRYRNNHKLAAGNYPIERVIAGEVFSDVIVEVTAAADETQYWVHRVRSLVLTTAAGEPDCLVLILVDLTDLASAEERFEKTFNANPAPALICRLSDQRYVKVNQGFIEMTGYEREHVLGRSVYQLDVFRDAQKRDLAIERLSAGETIPQMEASLKLPGDEEKLVVVAGQPIEMGDDTCMLFTFMDLDPRRKIEVSLRNSEARFAKAFQMTPVPTAVCSRENFQIVDANGAFISAIGYVAEDVIGKTPEEIGIFDRGDFASFAKAVTAGDSIGKSEIRITTATGNVITCLVSLEAVEIEDKPCALLVMTDITERKNTELELTLAIEAVMHDASWFSQSLMEKLTNARQGKVDAGSAVTLKDLTERERDVLGLMCEGLADKEIAKRLELAPNTVRNYVSGLYTKLDLHSRSEAMVWARARGIYGTAAAVTQPRKPRSATVLTMVGKRKSPKRKAVKGASET
jgi:PAS domain S-box-containing protein